MPSHGSNAPKLTVSYDATPPDASDTEDGYTGWPKDVISSPNNYESDAAGGGCMNDIRGQGAYASYQYETYVSKFDQLSHSLKVNEYDPEGRTKSGRRR